MLEIRNGPRSHESFQEMDLNDDWRLSKSEVKRQVDLCYVLPGKHSSPEIVELANFDNDVSFRGFQSCCQITRYNNKVLIIILRYFSIGLFLTERK